MSEGAICTFVISRIDWIKNNKLNQNSISGATDDFPGTFEEIAKFLFIAGFESQI